MVLMNKNRKWVFLSLLASFAAVGAQLVWTTYIGRLADRIEQREKLEGPFLVTMAILLAASALFQYINQLVNRYTAEKLGHTLRMRFADSLCIKNRMDSGISDSYEAMSKVQNELTQASEYMSTTLFDIIWMTLSAFFIIIFLFFQNAVLTLVLLIPVAIIVFIVQRSGKRLVPLVHCSMDGQIRHNRVAYSVITNYQAVQVFDGRQFFKDKYDEELDNWGRAEIRKERVSAVCNSMSGILSQVPLLLIFAAGVLMIRGGYITFGTLIIFINMQKSVLRTLMNLPTWMVSVKSFLVHLDRVDGMKMEV